MNKGFRFLEAFVVALLIVIATVDPDVSRGAAGRSDAARLRAVQRDLHRSRYAQMTHLGIIGRR